MWVIELTFPLHPPQPQSLRARDLPLPRHRKVHLFWKAARLYISLFESLAITVLNFNNPFTLEMHFCSYVINRRTFSQDEQTCFLSSSLFSGKLKILHFKKHRPTWTGGKCISDMLAVDTSCHSIENNILCFAVAMANRCQTGSQFALTLIGMNLIYDTPTPSVVRFASVYSVKPETQQLASLHST